MANIQRTDASSLSFARRLVNAERDAAQAKAELESLKQSLPSTQALQSAALTGETIKQQRKLAKQTMARADVGIEDLNAIDPAVLTPAFQEQLRGKKRDVLLAQEPQQPQMLQAQSPGAIARIENWRAQARLSAPQQKDFAASNLWPEQETAFQKWDRRSSSIAGRDWNQEQQRAQYQRTEDRLRFEYQQQNIVKQQGRNIGGIKDLK